MIPFNKPFFTGNETKYISDAVISGKISGNGIFTQKCQYYFEKTYNIKKCLLTTSCTDALEMAAILCNIKPGDEVIVPSYTFVSTALAFIRQGAKIIFVDSTNEHPNMDVEKIEELINSNTKAIVPVHYAGNACDMKSIMQLALKYNLYVIEDAAQAIDSYYIDPDTKMKIPLGTIGHFGAFSFHETKNIISGEGGMLAINDTRFSERAEIIWEKGTNRAKFFRGETDKYGWVDIGSSFLPSELISAFLWAQIENLEKIQKRRIEIWNYYFSNLLSLSQKGFFKLPYLVDYSSNNGHMFYIICKSLDERTRLISHLKEKKILSVFHYLSLHSSKYYADIHDTRTLGNSDYYSDHLLRLPFYFELTNTQIDYIITEISSFFQNTSTE